MTSSYIILLLKYKFTPLSYLLDTIRIYFDTIRIQATIKIGNFYIINSLQIAELYRSVHRNRYHQHLSANIHHYKPSAPKNCA